MIRIDLELRQWVPETDFLANPDTVRFKDRNDISHKRQIRPDGFFLIARERENRPEPEGFAFLLEIDMATHSNPSFERNKVRAGLAYLTSEKYRTTFRSAIWALAGRDHNFTHGWNIYWRQTETGRRKGSFYFTTFDLLAEAADLSRTGVFERTSVVGRRQSHS